MQKENAVRLRWTFVIAALATVTAAFILRQLRADADAGVAQAHTPATMMAIDASTTRIPNSSMRPAAALSPAVAQQSHAAPTASGAIHFERGADASADAHIDVNVRAAVGVWQPAQHRLLVYLLEQQPSREQVAHLIASQPATPADFDGVPGGMIDVEFTPTAQAFDRNEIDRASLTAWNGRGESSAADVLGSLDWSGSLPSAQADGAPAETQLELKAAGSGESMPIDWRQAWNLSVAVPVSASP